MSRLSLGAISRNERTDESSVRAEEEKKRFEEANAEHRVQDKVVRILPKEGERVALPENHLGSRENCQLHAPFFGVPTPISFLGSDSRQIAVAK